MIGFQDYSVEAGNVFREYEENYLLTSFLLTGSKMGSLARAGFNMHPAEKQFKDLPNEYRIIQYGEPTSNWLENHQEDWLVFED